MERKKKIMVIDAHGGGLGKKLVSMIKKDLPDLYVMAIGTNSAATAAMKKAGADEAATGENAVKTACRKADIILGPIGMVIADSMLGEFSGEMACAIARADAVRILIPFNHCDNHIVGVADFGTGRLLTEAVNQLKQLL